MPTHSSTEPASTEPVVKEIHIDASPETLFSYFTDPEKLTRWLCSEATTDPRPGGIVHQTHPGDDDNPNGPYYMHGEYLELEYPNRVVFTWGYLNSEVGVKPGTTKVEVDLTPRDGGTDLRLIHSGITAELPSDNYDKGWDLMLANLAGLDFD